jgi:hypothetical protein
MLKRLCKAFAKTFAKVLQITCNPYETLKKILKSSEIEIRTFAKPLQK